MDELATSSAVVAAEYAAHGGMQGIISQLLEVTSLSMIVVQFYVCMCVVIEDVKHNTVMVTVTL
jgi:hypothetical protein